VTADARSKSGGAAKTLKIDVLTPAGKKDGSVELPAELFDVEPNIALMHQVVEAQRAAGRQGTHSTKTRGEVRGGGKKPYRQKGTGYARQGSKTAPHYRGGGVVFGPHPRSYEKAFPRKMRRLALRSVLSSKAAEDALIIVDSFSIDVGKTKALLATLATLGATGGVVLVLGERSDVVFRAARNLDNVHVVTPNGLNLLDMLRLPRMVLTESAIGELTRTLTADLAPTLHLSAPEPAPVASESLVEALAEAEEPDVATEPEDA
jgi:large subunit ribosomal protein L4